VSEVPNVKWANTFLLLLAPAGPGFGVPAASPGFGGYPQPPAQSYTGGGPAQIPGTSHVRNFYASKVKAGDPRLGSNRLGPHLCYFWLLRFVSCTPPTTFLDETTEGLTRSISIGATAKADGCRSLTVMMQWFRCLSFFRLQVLMRTVKARVHVQ